MNQYVKTIIRFGLLVYIIIALSVVYLSLKDGGSSMVMPKVTEPLVSDIVDNTQTSTIPESPENSVPLKAEAPPEVIAEPPLLPATPSEPPNSPPPPQITPIERVLSHKTRSDCWIVVNGNVYNVTGYFGKHPGGDSTLASYCGKDASIGFETKELIPPQMHSMTAEQLLASFLIP